MARRSWWRRLARAVGPGFITGAADDDPSGIATYSQTGSLFGYSQLWLVPFAYPFMTAVQEMSGRIGMVCGVGLAGIMRRYYPRAILYGAIALLLIANVANIGADIAAMVSSIELIVPIPQIVLLAGIALCIIILQVYVPYPAYARFLKYLTFSLLAYVGTALIIHPPWEAILRATYLPQIVFSRDYLLNIAAFLGTTISPYLFFWQADEEVEEEIVRHEISEIGGGRPRVRRRDIADMRLDTALGMFFSQMITYFIIISVASTIGVSGMHEIATAADAASALRPIAGEWAFLLFALGIVGTSLLAVPVLAGSVSFAIAEAFQWKGGLEAKPSQAPAFYGTIAVVTGVGCAVGYLFLPVGAMTLLYWSAIINGLLAPPLLVFLLIVGNNTHILGRHTNGILSNVLGTIITCVMGAVALGLIYSLFVAG